MSLRKILAPAMVAIALSSSMAVEAASIGRSGGFSSSRSSFSSYKPSSSSSFRSSTASRPSSSISGGGSIGVRKSQITSQVAARKYQQPTTPSSYQTRPISPTPVAPVRTTNGVGSGAGGSFAAGVAGGVAGSLLGNALFGNHNNGGTTVVNTGPTGGVVDPGAVPAGTPVAAAAPGAVVVAQPQQSYGILSFLADLISFFFMVAILAAIAYGVYWMYKRYKAKHKANTGSILDKIRETIDPVSVPLPAESLTKMFFDIQRAFCAADTDALKKLIGPDMIDEVLSTLEPCEFSLSNVSYEVIHRTANELSVAYSFTDAGSRVDEVWHYEVHGNEWKLNGIESV